MATSLTAKVALAVSAEFADSLDIGSVNYPAGFGANYLFADGVGADLAKQIFTDTRTLTASATENLDLAGGLTNAFGSLITFTKIKALIVKADAANTNDVVLGAHATAAWVAPFGAVTERVNVKPGGMVAFIAPDATGYAVVATTGDMLRVLNSAGGTSVSYTIIIIGVV